MDRQGLHAMIAAAQAGSPEAYQALLEAYWPRLYGFFLRAVGNHHEAEDLLGELALRLVRNLTSYVDRGRFEPWLFRVAANMIRDRIRRLKVRPHVTSLSAEDDHGSAMSDRIEGEAPAVEKRLVAGEVASELNAALEQLDPTTRQMILLRHFSEMSFKEIAESYECPIGTVLAKVHRGLKQLRKLMGAEDATE